MCLFSGWDTIIQLYAGARRSPGHFPFTLTLPPSLPLTTIYHQLTWWQTAGVAQQHGGPRMRPHSQMDPVDDGGAERGHPGFWLKGAVMGGGGLEPKTLCTKNSANTGAAEGVGSLYTKNGRIRFSQL